VTAPTPARLLLDGHCLMVLERTLLAAAPDEGCALLLGRQRGVALQLEQIWPCRNIWQPAAERPRRFSLDPREQLLAQRWGRARGLSVLGAAHSHPSSEAVPSATDRELCIGPTLMLIRSGLLQGLEALRAWWMPEGDGVASPLEAPTELAIAWHGAPIGTGHLGE
jgi:proteasome lid subunit RPN8/RPN11